MTQFNSVYDIESDPTWKMRINWNLAASELNDFIDVLQRAKDGTEVRVELPPCSAIDGQAVGPQNWAFFFKVKPTDNRVLLAHPSQNDWVVTVALKEAVFGQLITELKAKAGSLVLDKKCSLSRVSNATISWNVAI